MTELVSFDCGGRKDEGEVGRKARTELGLEDQRMVQWRARQDSNLRPTA